MSDGIHNNKRLLERGASLPSTPPSASEPLVARLRAHPTAANPKHPAPREEGTMADLLAWLWFYVLPGARKRRNTLLAWTCGDTHCWVCNYGRGGFPEGVESNNG
jgi:hypothetical protein